MELFLFLCRCYIGVSITLDFYLTVNEWLSQLSFVKIPFLLIGKERDVVELTPQSVISLPNVFPEP